VSINVKNIISTEKNLQITSFWVYTFFSKGLEIKMLL